MSCANTFLWKSKVSIAWKEGVVFVGKAQEKTKIFRTERRVTAAGKKYPWIVESSGVLSS